MPLSHDEVVHGKGSLLEKMPGDLWQKFANLRLLFAYQYTRPGKKLLFMGAELAPHGEWDHRHSLDWHLAEDPRRIGLPVCSRCWAGSTSSTPASGASDPDPEGFAWIDCSDRDQSVVCYRRRSGDDELVVVVNATPVPRVDYRIGAPHPGLWVEEALDRRARVRWQRATRRSPRSSRIRSPVTAIRTRCACACLRSPASCSLLRAEAGGGESSLGAAGRARALLRGGIGGRGHRASRCHPERERRDRDVRSTGVRTR